MILALMVMFIKKQEQLKYINCNVTLIVTVCYQIV
jgi:hypothetical protein